MNVQEWQTVTIEGLELEQALRMLAMKKAGLKNAQVGSQDLRVVNGKIVYTVELREDTLFSKEGKQ
jgi:hypothetical protein